MGEEKSSEQTKQPPQPQPNDITEQRLQVLEKTNEKMFTILVWGFGTLSALAFALVAGNIYSSHSSYEKDTATLKQDVEMLQKQLTLERFNKNCSHLAEGLVIFGHANNLTGSSGTHPGF